jgi:hypothetical protein
MRLPRARVRCARPGLVRFAGKEVVDQAAVTSDRLRAKAGEGGLNVR